MKASGNTIIPIPCAAWPVFASSPIATNIHSNAKPNTTTRPNAASPSATLPCRRKPTAKPIATVTADAERQDRGVGDRPRREHRAARDRQRAQPVDEPLLEVLGRRDRRPDSREQDSRGDEAGHEDSRRTAPSRVDRAAEHVAVDQEEQRHLQRRHDDQLRCPGVAERRAARDRRACSRRARSTRAHRDGRGVWAMAVMRRSSFLCQAAADSARAMRRRRWRHVRSVRGRPRRASAGGARRRRSRRRRRRACAARRRGRRRPRPRRP